MQQKQAKLTQTAHVLDAYEGTDGWSRSPFFWFRTKEGDLILGTYPRDLLYEYLINGPDPIEI